LAQEARNAWEGICGNQALAHSADGRFFVEGPSGRCCLVRESATGRVVRELADSRGAFFGLFAPDASRVLLWHTSATGMGFAGVRLYDARTGRVTGEIKPVDYLGYPVFSPDGRIVAWGDRAHDVRLHDAVSGRVVRTLSSRRGLATEGSDASHLLFS